MSEALSHEKIAKDLAQVRIVRLVVKAKGTDVIEISCKFPRKTLAQIICPDRPLPFQDQLFQLRVIRGFEIVPRKRAPEEVEKHIS